ncbi:MAG: FtsX-like permease family protein [Planctomycetota bacterium]
MYKTLLISKYLRRKLAPLFAALAVMLCTAMVVIVISVMGGFLDTLKESAKSITGDLVIESAYRLRGFEHYAGLVERLEAMDEVAAATPAIRTMGLINFAGGPVPMGVLGVDFAGMDEVIGLADRALWSPAQLEERAAEADRLVELGFEEAEALAELLREFLPGDETGRLSDQSGSAERSGDVGLVGAWAGVAIYPWNWRQEDGSYAFEDAYVGRPFTLTVIPLNEAGTLGSFQPARKDFVVVNDFKSGLHDVDSSTVLVPLGVLQDMLEMGPRFEFVGEIDELTGEGGELTQTSDGRVNQVVVKIEPSVLVASSLTAVQERVQEEVTSYFEEVGGRDLVRVSTWEQVHGQLINAVQNEKGLVTFLFVVISLVAVVMVATTFYMTVLEKTRDIGTLRAMGASRVGIALLFLGYGLAIGVVGAGTGVGLATAVVLGLNQIQWFLATYLGVTGWLVVAAVGGTALGATAGTLIGFVRRSMRWWATTLAVVGGLGLFLPALAALFANGGLGTWLNAEYSFQMWDPQTYFFDTIPARLDWAEVTWIGIGAVISSVLGAVVPALVASAQDPVEALRYE